MPTGVARTRTRRARRGLLALLACGALAAALAAPASAETTPPSLTTLTLNPSVVNTSASGATVDIDITATDFGSGIHVVRAGLTGPTGVQFDTSFFGAPSSGNSNNGTWQLDVTLPQFSPQGNYELTIEIVDNDGNTLTLTPADLDALGVPHLVNQVAAGDDDSPTLGSLLISPTSVDATEDDRQVDLTVGGLDDLSGVDLLTATLTGPGSTVITGGTGGSPNSGTSTNGIWTFSMTVPAGSPLGVYTLELELTDRVGHVTTLSSAALASGGFPNSITNDDVTAPAVVIDTGPSGLTGDASPVFTFTAEAGSTVECSLDQGTPSFGACSGPASHAPAAALADGSWILRVNATGPSNNSQTATRSFIVDTAAPDTQITSGPSGLILTASADFGFSSPDVGASFECRLDGSAFANCNPPRTYGGLADGEHTFEVRAVDAAGNRDQSPASQSFTVDAQDPVVTITSGPSGTTGDQRPTFEFEAEAGTTVQCSFDRGDPHWGPCTTGSSARPEEPLDDGGWTFRVQATDAGGHSATATREFAVDSGLLDTVIESGPAAKTFKNRVKFTFSAKHAVAFECRFDKDGWRACKSPAIYKKLKKGKHKFLVRAIDAAGEVEATPAKVKFKVVLISL